MCREGRNDAVEIARQEKNRWKKRALNAEATIAKVMEWADEHPSTGTLLAILDESPTDREGVA